MNKITLSKKIKSGIIASFATMCILLSGCGVAESVEGSKVTQTDNKIKVTHVRNATSIIEYADTKFLVDPMLSDKGTFAPFGTYPIAEMNPLVDLPTNLDINEIIDVDAVIVTHLHEDHFDGKAAEVLPKDIPMFAQNEADQQQLESYGFENVTILDDATSFNGVSLIRTDCQHGVEPSVVEVTGNASGVIFKADEEKTLYLAGDSVWYDSIKETLNKYKPEVIIANVGGNTLYLPEDNELGLKIEVENPEKYNGYYRLIFDANETLAIHEALPSARIMAVHLEAVNHATVSRDELRAFAEEKGFSDMLDIPLDGETIEY